MAVENKFHAFRVHADGTVTWILRHEEMPPVRPNILAPNRNQTAFAPCSPFRGRSLASYILKRRLLHDRLEQRHTTNLVPGKPW